MLAKECVPQDRLGGRGGVEVEPEAEPVERGGCEEAGVGAEF